MPLTAAQIKAMQDAEGGAGGVTNPPPKTPQQQAMEEAEAAAKGPGVVEDVVRSTGAGLRQGAEGLVGLPQDLTNLVGRGVGWLTNTNQNWDIPYLPSSSDVHQYTTKDLNIGESYQPQTTPGKFARAIGEQVPGMILPGGGGLVTRAATAVGAGVGGEGAKQLAEGTGYEPWAELAGGIVGGGLGGLRKPTLSADDVAVQTQMRRFGIEPTKGQITGDIAQQSAEELMKKGSRGPWAQRLMKNRAEANKEAVESSGLSLRDTMAPGRGAEPVNSADILNWSARRHVKALKDAGAAKIDEALKAGVWIDSSKFGNLKTHLADALEGQGKGTGVPEFVIDDLTPTAKAAINRIDKFLETIPKGAEVNLAGAEQIRRNIGKLAASDPNDNRVLGAVRRAYDQWMDDAVNTGVRRVGNGQLPGPGVPNTTQDVLTSLKEGRADYRKAMELEDPRKGPGSGMVKSIATEGTTGGNIPEKTLRFFTPDNNGNMKLEAAPVIEQLQRQFPQGSPEMAQIKDMVMAQLTQGDSGRIASRIDNFINNNPSVANKLFSTQELDQLRDWGVANRRMSPPKETIYPSSGPVISAINNKMGNVGTLLGGFLGGGPGAAVGAAIDFGFKGVPTLLGSRAAKAALEPTRETLSKMMTPGAIKGAIPGGRSLTIDAPGEENNGMDVKLAPDQPEDSNFVRVIRPDGKSQLVGKNLVKGLK